MTTVDGGVIFQRNASLVWKYVFLTISNEKSFSFFYCRRENKIFELKFEKSSCRTFFLELSAKKSSGVEETFAFSRRVFFSFHLTEKGNCRSEEETEKEQKNLILLFLDRLSSSSRHAQTLAFPLASNKAS